MTPIYKFALREDLKENKEFLPFKAEKLSTGYDVRASMPDKQPLIIKPFQHVRIPLGFRTFCPEGWWFKLNPRSSTFAKKYLHSLYGVIDESWEGETVLAAQYIPDLSFGDLDPNTFTKEKLYITNYSELTINFGDPIAQIIPCLRQEMGVMEVSNEEIDKLYEKRGADRRTGGFGSTSGE